MATQPDNIDVPHLVRIGLIGTILIIATSYFVVGLAHSEHEALRIKRGLAMDAAAAAESEQGAAAGEDARKAVIDEYAR